jgi:hypothetical protein
MTRFMRFNSLAHFLYLVTKTSTTISRIKTTNAALTPMPAFAPELSWFCYCVVFDVELDISIDNTLTLKEEV